MLVAQLSSCVLFFEGDFPGTSVVTQLIEHLYPPGNDRISPPKLCFEDDFSAFPLGGICDVIVLVKL